MGSVTESLERHIDAVDRELKDDGLPAVVSARQASAALAFTNSRTITDFCAGGEIKAAKIGRGRWRIRRRELAAFIVRRER